MTIIMILAAIWLIIAPFILEVSTAALWTSIIAGIVAGVFVLISALGSVRFYVVAVVGLYLIVSAFFFGGEALWSGLIAGVVLAILGFYAALQKPAVPPQAPEQAPET